MPLTNLMLDHYTSDSIGLLLEIPLYYYYWAATTYEETSLASSAPAASVRKLT